jgi:hypothetical protein
VTPELRPITLRQANALVAAHHRHAPQVRGCICCVGLAVGAEYVGAAIVSRPVARGHQDGYTAEVSRLVVADGIPNGCSQLYGAAWRAARALGYRRLITYTLTSESGVSLRASGWQRDGESTRAMTGNGWDNPARPRAAGQRLPRLRWVKLVDPSQHAGSIEREHARATQEGNGT